MCLGPSHLSDCSAVVAVTNEMVLDIKAIKWNRNLTATILIAVGFIFHWIALLIMFIP